MTITRFLGDNGSTYTFPTDPGDQDFRTNFGEILARSARMPGADGGLDEYGRGRAPKAVGSIQFSFYLVTSARADMQANRDAVRAMQNWGAGRLYDSLNGVERWAYCRVNNITISENRHAQTDLHQQVQISFQASSPYWHTAGNELLWDSGLLWGASGQYWDGSASSLDSITGSGTVTVTNNGSAFTVARIVLVKNTGTTVRDIRMRRMVNSEVKDEVRWNSTLYSGQSLNIDSRRHKVYGTSGEVSLTPLTYLHPDWMRLEPGSNSIQVLTDDGNEIKVGLRYLERYA